jgi:D-alanyl-D-alanine carboxypeptidase
MAVGMAVGDELLFASGWGRVGAGEPAHEESLFRAGSLSQQLITIGILDLVDAGALNLDDEVSVHLPEMKYERDEITLLDLLQHSSGLPHSDEALMALDDVPDAAQVFDWLPTQPLRAEPGTCLVHSGVNTILLGTILERATELSVREYVEQRVIFPLGLEDTIYCYDGPPLRGLDASVQEVGTAIVPDDLGQAFFAADALCTSAVDLVRLQRAIAGREIVSEAGLERMATDELFPDGTPIRYLGGFSQATMSEFEALSFGGGMAGGRVHASWYPAIDLTVVVLASSEDAPVAAIERRLTRAFLDQPDPTTLDEVLPPEVRALYVGGYYVGCTRYLIVEENERLRLTPPTGPSFALLSQGAHRFVSADDPDVRLTFHVEDDRALSFVLIDHGTEMVAVRVEQPHQPRRQAP